MFGHHKLRERSIIHMQVQLLIEFEDARYKNEQRFFTFMNEQQFNLNFFELLMNRP